MVSHQRMGIQYHGRTHQDSYRLRIGARRSWKNIAPRPYPRIESCRRRSGRNHPAYRSDPHSFRLDRKNERGSGQTENQCPRTIVHRHAGSPRIHHASGKRRGTRRHRDPGRRCERRIQTADDRSTPDPPELQNPVCHCCDQDRQDPRLAANSQCLVQDRLQESDRTCPDRV